MGSYYLTTAIDYANGEPHLGHAVEKIGADVIARYRRALGDDVHYLIGMDEHGQKVALEAESRGLEPQEWVDRVAESFRSAWDRLGISHDDFVRTTEARHHRGVRALLERIRAAGDIYPATYTGYYCTGCEAFKKEDDLEDDRCPLHPSREILWTEEENLFFRLSDYREALLEHVRSHPDFVRPESRRNEMLRLLEAGLDDISASRSRLPWGVPFPGEEGHTAYVWFDALPNYITAIGFPDEEYETWWPAQLHVIGKDIARFHCIIWPAMLMSAGLEPPECVWAHGFINLGGGKLSKSEGQQLELPTLIERHGPDPLRYFLMREVPWDGDRDFPSASGFLEGFDERYNAELANDLGNLLNRVLAMVSKYRDGTVPARPAGETADADGEPTPLDEARSEAETAYHEAMEGHLLHRGLDAVFQLVRGANGYVDEAQPWSLARGEREGDDPAASRRLDAALGSLVRTLGACAALLAPFMPAKSAEIWRGVGGQGEPPGFGALEAALGDLEEVHPGPVLFPRFEPEEAAEPA